LDLFDVPQRQLSQWLRHPRYLINPARWSPDGGWIAFFLSTSPSTRRVYAAPFNPAVPPPESDWVALTDGNQLDREPRWSADGRLIYFLSNRDGHECIWAQPVDPALKRPLGRPFNVLHLHEPQRKLPEEDTGPIGFSVGKGLIVFSMPESTGNIWMTDAP
jgi:hypothetical protein